MDPISGEVPEIPSTAEGTEKIFEQAEELAKRVHDSPDFKVLMNITQRTQRLSTFNFVYSIILTFLFTIVAIIGYNTYHNGLVIDGIKKNCVQDNTDKAADLEAWRFILSLFPEGEDKQHILEQREKANAPIDC